MTDSARRDIFGSRAIFVILLCAMILTLLFTWWLAAVMWSDAASEHSNLYAPSAPAPNAPLPLE